MLFLLGSDAIIRQHKAACLRVTALLACKDLLWIGTSAGVVLTLPLPTITASTASLRNCPSATASFHGHTGHVRFLTAVEVPREGTQDNTNDKGSTTTISTTLSTSPSTPTAPHASGSSAGRDVLIISGGDGYEDFRTSSASESAGRDDSTNHLLIWRVWFLKRKVMQKKTFLLTGCCLATWCILITISNRRDFRIPRGICDLSIRIGTLRILHEYLPKVASRPTQFVDERRPEF